MGGTDYAYATANIRANEHKLLTKADFRGMIAAPSAEEVLRLLKDKGFGISALRQTGDELIKAQNEKVFSYVRELAGENEIFNSFLMRNDFHNLKVRIKAKIAALDCAGMLVPPGFITPDEMEFCINRAEFSTLPAWINRAAEHAFRTTAETKDGQLCDIIMDKAMMEAMKEAAKRVKNEFMQGLFEKQSALANIGIALRACRAKKDAAFTQNALIDCHSFDIRELAAAAQSPDTLAEYLTEKGCPEGAKAIHSGGITAFECYADNQIIEYIKLVNHNIFGIEPLIAYLIYNEMEQKNVRIMLTGKRAGVSENRISERMRDSYA